MKILCKLGFHKWRMLNKDKMPYIDKYSIKGILHCDRCGKEEEGIQESLV